MKYDDASWHYGGNFPDGLPEEAGGTHIAMFAMWCWLNGLAGEALEEFPEALAAVRDRSWTPTKIFVHVSDQKFTYEDLSDAGNAFAQAYYGEQGYYSDYGTVVAAAYPTLYHVPDSWDTYDRVAPMISKHYRAWQNRQKGWLQRLWPSTKS